MDYVSTVANNLIGRSFCGPVPDFEIYTIIANWEKREIPLSVVMSSIDEYCAERSQMSSETDPVDRLQALVNRKFRAWLEEPDRNK